jgi:hypothetical protein
VIRQLARRAHILPPSPPVGTPDPPRPDPPNPDPPRPEPPRPELEKPEPPPPPPLSGAPEVLPLLDGGVVHALVDDT